MEADAGSAPRRRRRHQLSCVQCRQRKVKCDHQRPCNRCRVRGWFSECNYRDDSPNPQTASTSVAARPRITTVGQEPFSPSTSISSTPLGAAVGHGYGSESVTPASRILAAPQLPVFRQNLRGSTEAPSSHGHPAGGTSQQVGNASNYAFRTHFGATTYHGQSSVHWLMQKFHQLMSDVHNGEDSNSGKRLTYVRLKREINKRQALAEDEDEVQQQPSLGISYEVPHRQVTEFLVNRYLDTYESVFPVFDLSSFQKEYESFWESPEQARLVFVIMLLMVISIGNSTLQDEEEVLPQATVRKWWRLALTWLGAATETNDHNIGTLQTGCLVVLIRQACSFNEFSDWISSGTLVKNAMAMGFHRDPVKLTGVPPDEYESRRRIWHTILELDLQCCLDAGMQPTLRAGDWDTLSPSASHNDHSTQRADDLGTSSVVGLQSPRSMQAELVRSFHIRMAVSCFTNSIIADDNYDRVLQLSAELTKSMNRLLHNRQPDKVRSMSVRFQYSLLQFLYYRYLLALHTPFALRNDPKFSFSQNACLTAALAVLDKIEPPCEEAGRPNDGPFWNPAQISNRTFKCGAFYAVLYLCDQLLRKPSEHEVGNVFMETPFFRQRVCNAIEVFIKFAEQRLKNTKFAGRGFLIPSIVLAHSRIFVAGDGKPQEQKEKEFRDAADDIGKRCFGLFRGNADVARIL